MELKPRAYDKILALAEKGVEMPNPWTLDIGEEVAPDRISGRGVILFPGCRIYGRNTVISAGARIGYEGPATIDDCQIGPGVELKGGYFNKAVFLEKSSLGLGAHVREGTILEEEANGAHCVGLKQTILFPFVTLGSLINLCDCLVAGGTSRKDHSEVGSSYIHFNYTPDGDKTTASLVGDVPRGVMLNRAPIFLGGQGGMVGPIRVNYGNVVAAGTVLRTDVDDEDRLVFGQVPTGENRDRRPHSYRTIARVVGNNIRYLANLVALEHWYAYVRRPFFDRQELGNLVYAGAMARLASAKEERTKRLEAMAAKAKASIGRYEDRQQSDAGKREFYDAMQAIDGLFAGGPAEHIGAAQRSSFLDAAHVQGQSDDQKYVDFIKGLPAETSEAGARWLQAIVDHLCRQAQALMPSLHLFSK